LTFIQEISGQSLDVDEHGYSIHHTLSERDKDDFHLGSGFGPDILREPSDPLFSESIRPGGLKSGMNDLIS
jgi:hypothetical protein